MNKRIIALLLVILVVSLSGCGTGSDELKTDVQTTQSRITTTTQTTTAKTTESTSTTPQDIKTEETITWNEDWEFSEYSIIHSASVVKYYAVDNRKDITICVNAGHGTKGGSSVYTYCHPDKTPKVTGGSTQKGAIKATSINEGTTLLSGESEAVANLKLAKILKDELLESGYDVLMIRESSDTQLDNIARTLFANNNADCHISIHYDSSTNDKGMFYIGIPNVESYRKMYPVCDTWEQSEKLGQSIIDSSKQCGVNIFSDGNMPLDLTQTSYSTIPSIDLEVGDRASKTADATNQKIVKGIIYGINTFFE